jgi:hypothetical protein
MRVWVFAMILVNSAAAVLQAAPLSELEQQAGKERKERAVAAVKKEIADLESYRSVAAKEGDGARAREIVKELKAKKAELVEAVKRPIEEYAADVLREHKAAEAAEKIAEEEQRERKRREDANALAKKAADAKTEQEDEIDRRNQSGNCPLKLKMATFRHLGADAVSMAVHGVFLPKEVPRPKTLVTCRVENRSGQPVEAYEIFLELLDGFDAVVKEHRFQGTSLADGEEISVSSGIEPVEVAAQMRIYVQRAKTQDGTVWERKPEHQRVGLLVKEKGGARTGDKP